MTDAARPFDDDDVVEAMLSGRGAGHLAALLTELRGVADRPAPEPSPALAALLRSGLPVDELARRRGRRTLIAGVAVASAAATLALSGVAAAHDALPGPAEHVITGIINNLTPFDVTPRPASSSPTDVHGPGHGRTGQPEPGDDRSGRGADGGGSSGGSDDGSGSSSGGGSGSGSGSSDDGSGSGSGSGSSGGGSDDGSGSGSGSGGGSGSGSGSSGGGSDDGSGSGSGGTSGSGASGGGSGGSGSGSGDSGGSGSSGGSGGTSGSGSGGSDGGSGHSGRG